VQAPFAARRQQAIGDQHEQDLIPARPLAAHPQPVAGLLKRSTRHADR
jgi:hypothetical protein